MPNRSELFNEVLTNLFKVGDKSKKEYDLILDEFDVSELQDIKDLSTDILQKILNKTKSILKIGSKTMFTSKKFDKEVGDTLLRQAMKLAEELENEEKETPNEVPEEEQKKSPQEEEKEENKQEQEEGEQEEAKTIEDTVKDQQVALIEKMNAVKTFKPGRSEAINFRNAVKELIEIAESSVRAINNYYQKELGGEEKKEKFEGKTSSNKRGAVEHKKYALDQFNILKGYLSTIIDRVSKDKNKEALDYWKSIVSLVINLGPFMKDFLRK